MNNERMLQVLKATQQLFNLNQAEMAEKLGFTRNMYNMIVNDKKKFPFNKLKDLAEYASESYEELVLIHSSQEYMGYMKPVHEAEINTNLGFVKLINSDGVEVIIKVTETDNEMLKLYF